MEDDTEPGDQAPREPRESERAPSDPPGWPPPPPERPRPQPALFGDRPRDDDPPTEAMPRPGQNDAPERPSFERPAPRPWEPRPRPQVEPSPVGRTPVSGPSSTPAAPGTSTPGGGAQGGFPKEPSAPRLDDTQVWSPTRPASPVPPARTPDAAPTQRVTPPPPTTAMPRATTGARSTEEKRGAVTVRRLRRGRLAIRKIDPWAVLKFSLVFYFCMLVITMFALAIIFSALRAFGVIDNLEQLLRDLDYDVSITGGFLFRWVFLLGLAGTVIASAVSMFMAFLYNLIADVVGGIELLVTERE